MSVLGATGDSDGKKWRSRRAADGYITTGAALSVGGKRF